MERLYETDWIDRLDSAIVIDETTGEIVSERDHADQNEITAELAADLDARIDRYADAIRTFESNADACNGEASRFRTREVIWRNKAKRAKEWLMLSMLAAGRKKVGTATTTATVCANGGKEPLDIREPIERIPERFVRTQTIRSVDTDALRAALATGDPEAKSVASIMERGQHLRLR